MLVALAGGSGAFPIYDLFDHVWDAADSAAAPGDATTGTEWTASKGGASGAMTIQRSGTYTYRDSSSHFPNGGPAYDIDNTGAFFLDWEVLGTLLEAGDSQVLVWSTSANPSNLYALNSSYSTSTFSMGLNDRSSDMRQYGSANNYRTISGQSHPVHAWWYADPTAGRLGAVGTTEDNRAVVVSTTSTQGLSIGQHRAPTNDIQADSAVGFYAIAKGRDVVASPLWTNALAYFERNWPRS